VVQEGDGGRHASGDARHLQRVRCELEEGMKWYALMMALICATIVGGALRARDYATVVIASVCMTGFALVVTRKDK